MSGNASKKKTEEFNRSNPIIKITSKPKSYIPKKKPNLSNSCLHKAAISSPISLNAEEYNDADCELAKKFIEANKLSLNFLSGKDLVYYNQLNEILKDKRHSISFLRGTEFHNAVIKLIKPSLKPKEHLQGNFVIPKTFDFSAKGIQQKARLSSENKRQKQLKILNNTTF